MRSKCNSEQGPHGPTSPIWTCTTIRRYSVSTVHEATGVHRQRRTGWNTWLMYSSQAFLLLYDSVCDQLSFGPADHLGPPGAPEERSDAWIDEALSDSVEAVGSARASSLPEKDDAVPDAAHPAARWPHQPLLGSLHGARPADAGGRQRVAAGRRDRRPGPEQLAAICHCGQHFAHVTVRVGMLPDKAVCPRQER